MHLYLIRHGQSVANLKRIHNTPDTTLTEEGRAQAEAIAKRLKNFDIDFIYSSTQLRAQQTAEIVASELALPIELWGDIVEVKTPSVNWGKPVSNKKAAQIEKIVDLNYLKGEKHSDEESFEEIRGRAQKVLGHLTSRHKGKNILCVSHTSFIKMIVLNAIANDYLTPSLYLKFRHHARLNNSGVTILEYKKGRGWILDTWNDTSHL